MSHVLQTFDRARTDGAAVKTHLRLGLAAVLLAGGCASAPEPAQPDVHATVHKSPNDTREYRSLTLPNRLKVLLVSDPNTDKAAASLVVQRGSFHEPEDRPGIAHFL